MIKTVYKYSLVALEKLDKRDTFTKRFGYYFARKIYDKSFFYIYKDSPYNYNRWYAEDILKEEEWLET
jgi:hypothetical protein